MATTNIGEPLMANKAGNGDVDGRPAAKRRSSRVVIDIPVVLFGQSSDRKMFEEQTKTLTVSAHGALISLKADIDSGRPVLMSNPRTGMEVQCRVAHRKDSKDGEVEVGLEFSNALPKFWGIHFPPEDWNPAERKKASSPYRSAVPNAKGSKK
jgi:hypothetical protein